MLPSFGVCDWCGTSEAVDEDGVELGAGEGDGVEAERALCRRRGDARVLPGEGIRVSSTWTQTSRHLEGEEGESMAWVMIRVRF